MTPLLAAHNVHKTYRLGRVDVPVLRGVSFSVAKGEFVAIVGASGSGKSTLLHLLGGLDRPDRKSVGLTCAKCGYLLQGLKKQTCPDCATPFADTPPGGIVYAGRALSDFSAGEMDRYRSTGVGFVFQFYHLLPELTVVQNVALAAMIRHGRLGYLSRRAETTTRAETLLGAVGLGHRLRHRPAELSGGERQRVAIARALMNDPPVLLADEPTGNLDHTAGEGILDALVASRKESGRAIVLVTHDREVAARADRTVRLVDGKLAEQA